MKDFSTDYEQKYAWQGFSDSTCWNDGVITMLGPSIKSTDLLAQSQHSIKISIIFDDLEDGF